MNNRPICTWAIAFALGLIASLAFLNESKVLLVFAVAGILLVAAFLKPFRITKAATLILLFSFGFFHYKTAYDNALWYLDTDLDGQYAEVLGTLSAKSYTDGTWTYTLEDVKIICGKHIYQGNSVLVYDSFSASEAQEQSSETGTSTTSYAQWQGLPNNPIRYGNRVRFQGTIAFFDTAHNPGNFDPQSYYNSKKIDFSLTGSSFTVEDDHYNRVKENLFLLQQRLKKVYETAMTEEDAGVMATMVLGDKTLLDPDLKALYQQSGISHILAISGLHISIIGMLLYKLLRKRGLSFLLSGLLSGTLVTAYGIMSGMSLSTFRAVVMCWLLLLGNIIGRSYDSYTSLAVAAICLLTENPLSLTQASFQLSFCAVLGAVGVAPCLSALWNPKKRKYLDSAILCLAIQLTTLPILLFHYFEIATYTILINVLVLPFVSYLLIFGIFGGFAGFIAIGLAKVILFPCHLILAFYTTFCSFFAEWPSSSLILGRPENWQIILYYAGFLASICLIRHHISENTAENDKKKHYFLRNFSPVLLMSFFLLFFIPNDAPVFAMLDVGQGDGIYLSDGDGMHCFVDGGSTTISQVGKYRILPYLKYMGIRQIDYWFVSHTDSDHISGLLEILASGYCVRNLVFPTSLDASDENAAELLAAAEENGTNVVYFSEGDFVESREMKLQCLFPRKTDEFEDINDGCLVLKLNYGNVCGLLVGDLGETSEKLLLKRGLLSEVDFLKVGHHGSKTSSSEEFLEAISPKFGFISAGLNNSYGHPAGETLARLEKYGIEVHRTDLEKYIRFDLNNYLTE